MNCKCVSQNMVCTMRFGDDGLLDMFEIVHSTISFTRWNFVPVYLISFILILSCLAFHETPYCTFLCLLPNLISLQSKFLSRSHHGLGVASPPKIGRIFICLG